MSASEKLKALKERWLLGRWTQDTTPRSVLDALPQIVAVVEAAEWAEVYSLRDAISEQPLTDLAAIQAKVAPALAALEEALSYDDIPGAGQRGC